MEEVVVFGSTYEAVSSYEGYLNKYYCVKVSDGTVIQFSSQSVDFYGDEEESIVINGLPYSRESKIVNGTQVLLNMDELDFGVHPLNGPEFLTKLSGEIDLRTLRSNPKSAKYADFVEAYKRLIADFNIH